MYTDDVRNQGLRKKELSKKEKFLTIIIGGDKI